LGRLRDPCQRLGGEVPMGRMGDLLEGQ
jgi:hypothetical protein